MPFKARVVMFLFGGLLFGGGAVVATGNLMDVSSGDMTTAVVAGLVDGLGLALLLIAHRSSGRRAVVLWLVGW